MKVVAPAERELQSESRYALFDEIAAGGMATVHLGRMTGALGFARTVAIKRMHPHLARDADFVAMFIDEAHLAARVRHPNVVATMDVVRVEGELLLVMEYVPGESLSGIAQATRRRAERIPHAVVASIVSGVLFGLHAAHEATDERGLPLHIVHRDVTPANVLVGVDGISRVLDFGIAKANVRVQSTREGQLKGKLRYMAPEQLCDEPVTRRTDVYAASMILWEMLTGERLFWASNEGAVVARILEGRAPPPSSLVDDVPAALDAVVMKGLARDPAARFETAREMALALERAVPPAPAHAVGEWLERTAGELLRARASRVARIEGAGEDGQATAQSPQIEVTVTHAVTPAVAAPHTGSMATPVRLVPAPPPRTSTARMPVVAAPAPLDTAIAQANEETQRALRLRTRRWATAAVAVSAATTLLVALVAVVASRRSATRETAAGANVTATVPDASAVNVAVSPAPAPSAVEIEIAATSSAVPSAVAPRPPTHGPRPAASATARPGPDCNPPYVEDASGRRRVKRECL